MDIKIPEVGESITEATIAKWHQEDGAAVAKDDVLCELETDKITFELNAETSGTLKIQTGEGETVKIGAVIGRIEEGAPAKKTPEAKAKPEEKPAAEKEKKPPAPKAAEREKRPEPTAERPAKAAEPPERERPAAPPRATDERTTRQPMSPLRKTIAERLLAARQQTAMLTTFNEADMSRVVELRRRHQEPFRQKHGVGLGLMSFFVKACVEALREYPEVNARIDGNDIVHHHFYDIGIAVGSDKGLVVPVLRDAQHLTFAEIERAILDFVEKIKANRLALADLQGGTFTITNGGVYGSLLSTPILNPPQSGVLGMHAIQDRPVVRDGQVVIRPMMYLALSYDHRLIDGRQAVSFLRRVKQFIEEPEEMLLEL